LTELLVTVHTFNIYPVKIFLLNSKVDFYIYLRLKIVASGQGLPVPAVGTSKAVTITHVFLWGSRATNHIENALMGCPCLRCTKK
jgi:hypothetical protein